MLPGESGEGGEGKRGEGGGGEEREGRGGRGKGREGEEKNVRHHTMTSTCALECTSYFPISESSCHGPHIAPLVALKLNEHMSSSKTTKDPMEVVRGVSTLPNWNSSVGGKGGLAL